MRGAACSSSSSSTRQRACSPAPRYFFVGGCSPVKTPQAFAPMRRAPSVKTAPIAPWRIPHWMRFRRSTFESRPTFHAASAISSPTVAIALRTRSSTFTAIAAVVPARCQPLNGHARDEVVDEPTCDRERARDGRQLVGAIPGGLDELGVVELDLAACPACGEPDHQLARERPRLAREVAHVLDRDPDLLAHLAANRLLERLARLDEAREH